MSRFKPLAQFIRPVIGRLIASPLALQIRYSGTQSADKRSDFGYVELAECIMHCPAVRPGTVKATSSVASEKLKTWPF